MDPRLSFPRLVSKKRNTRTYDRNGYDYSVVRSNPKTGRVVKYTGGAYHGMLFISITEEENGKPHGLKYTACSKYFSCSMYINGKCEGYVMDIDITGFAFFSLYKDGEFIMGTYKYPISGPDPEDWTDEEKNLVIECIKFRSTIPIYYIDEGGDLAIKCV